MIVGYNCTARFCVWIELIQAIVTCALATVGPVIIPFLGWKKIESKFLHFLELSLAQLRTSSAVSLVGKLHSPQKSSLSKRLTLVQYQPSKEKSESTNGTLGSPNWRAMPF